MANITGVVNYGVAGNIHSIKKAIEAAGGTVRVIDSANEFERVDRVVIPGVGSFKDAMTELTNVGYIEAINKTLVEKPVLGICLGMQILATLGFEYGKRKGLGAIQAEVKPIQVNAVVPHMGFNKLDVVVPNSILSGIENEEFYFMHSFEMVNYTDVAALTDYAGHRFVSAVRRGNVHGVQFHPEKSRDAGIRLFSNFLAL